MLIVQPRGVSFGAVVWSGVSSVSIGRRAAKSFVEFGDEGPHAVLADVPEQRVDVTVVQELAGDDAGALVPGESGVLSFEAGPNSSGAGRTRVTLTGVVMSVRYAVSQRSGSVRTVELVAISSDGVVDPVVVESV